MDYRKFVSKKHGAWMLFDGKDEKVETKPDTVEHWSRSADNLVGGFYGFKKGFKSRFGMYHSKELSDSII